MFLLVLVSHGPMHVDPPVIISMPFTMPFLTIFRTALSSKWPKRQ